MPVEQDPGGRREKRRTEEREGNREEKGGRRERERGGGEGKIGGDRNRGKKEREKVREGVFLSCRVS